MVRWWRRRVDELGNPAGPQRRPGRFGRGIAAIHVESAIERTFRYIEMVAVTALLGTILEVFDPTAARVGLIVMATVAGLYVALPFLRWLDAVHGMRRRNDNLFMRGMVALGFAMSTALSAHGLQILIAATVQIDAEMARARYELWNAQQSLSGCVQAGRFGRPWADVEHCVEEQTERRDAARARLTEIENRRAAER